MLVTEVPLLILGAGWTSTFLIPLLERSGIRYAATTTNGRNGTIPFKFDPESDDPSQFKSLPDASTVLIVFPLKGTGQASRLVRLYADTRSPSSSTTQPNYIQLGVTTLWLAPEWQDETSPYNKEDPRAIAEDELMRSAPGAAAVLSLAGLYGGDRQPRTWLRRVVKSKEELRAKGALHVIHGHDVARAVLALHRNFTPDKRWILCDMHVYDWWDLALGWGAKTEEGGGDEEMVTWVGELMVEEGVKALPRDVQAVGRRLDGRAFWKQMGIWPSQGRLR